MRKKLIMVLFSWLAIAIVANAKNQSSQGSLDNSTTQISICKERFPNDAKTNIVVYWDSNLIKINGVIFKLEGTVINKKGSGIATSYVNKFGRLVYNVITNSNPPYNGDFFVTVDAGTNIIITSVSLSCVKSFDKPFMKRMLNKITL
jgi:hypothetical protein